MKQNRFEFDKHGNIKVSKNHNIYENDVVIYEFDRPVIDHYGDIVGCEFSAIAVGIVGFSLAEGRFLKKNAIFISDHNNSTETIEPEEFIKSTKSQKSALWLADYPKKLKVSRVKVIGNISEDENLFNDKIEELKDQEKPEFINGIYQERTQNETE